MDDEIRRFSPQEGREKRKKLWFLEEHIEKCFDC